MGDVVVGFMVPSFGDVNDQVVVVGIHIKNSPTCHLRDISLTSKYARACLRFPPMTIGKSTKTLFFDLIAYEMIVDLNHHDFMSNLCFLDCLIDHVIDVKELQYVGVL